MQIRVHPRQSAKDKTRGLRHLLTEKGYGILGVAHLLDEGFHVAQVVFQGAAAGGSEFVFSFWEAAFKIFGAGDVSRFFEFAGMDAEIAVSSIHQPLERAECQRLICSEGADDSEPQALVNQTIEVRRGALLL